MPVTTKDRTASNHLTEDMSHIMIQPYDASPKIGPSSTVAQRDNRSSKKESPTPPPPNEHSNGDDSLEDAGLIGIAVWCVYLLYLLCCLFVWRIVIIIFVFDNIILQSEKPFLSLWSLRCTGHIYRHLQIQIFILAKNFIPTSGVHVTATFCACADYLGATTYTSSCLSLVMFAEHKTVSRILLLSLPGRPLISFSSLTPFSFPQIKLSNTSFLDFS